MMKNEVSSIDKSGSIDKKTKSLVFSKYAECCYQTSKTIKEEGSVDKWNAAGKYSGMIYDTDEYINKALEVNPLEFRAQYIRARQAADKYANSVRAKKGYLKQMEKLLGIYKKYLKIKDSWFYEIMQFSHQLLILADFSKKKKIVDGLGSSKEIYKTILEFEPMNLKYTGDDPKRELQEAVELKARVRKELVSYK
ncbi:MAG: hypothetical protein K9H14_03510 [Actinomycetia bacterium]|nr:hypothetical protein [Actinomycetes bacterium]